MMPWRWRRTLIAFGAIVPLALGLLASSAFGYFTTHGSGTGSATTATLSGAVAVSTPSSSAPGGYRGPCTSASVGCTSITLPTVAVLGSIFDTTAIPITITNTGSIPITESTIQLTATANGTAGNYLRDEMNVCISRATTVVANGPLSYGLTHDPSVIVTGPTLAPGAADIYAVDFYAGQDSTTCNKTASDDPTTAAAWGPYVTPLSLTNAAEGGAVDVTLTWSYTN
jgi:hypothetical protein